MTGKDFRLARYEHLNSRLGAMESSHIASWLHGFVKSMGYKEASRLLKNVGVLEPIRPLITASVDEIPATPRPAVETTDHYKVGDVIQANYNGYGKWYWAEISYVLPSGHYNVHYLEDCSSEVGMRISWLRRNGTIDADESLDVQLMEKLARETVE